MRKIILVMMLLIACIAGGFAQDCKVLVTAIGLNYAGDCKSGKAEGKGKAVGQDTYDGDFKSGYPEGDGKYTWKDGSWFTGAWKKGLREGQGEMHYKTATGIDSAIAGFWKKDVYQGRFEKPFKILNQSTKVSTAKVTKNAGNNARDIMIIVQNTSGGASVSNGTSTFDMPKLKVSDIDIAKGNFASKLEVDNTARQTKTQLRGVEFPFRATFRIDSQMVEIEFYEEGNYTVDINIMQ